MQKLALLIGINDYPELSPRDQLHGCVNDARSLAAVFRDRFGFPEDGITVLLDAQATRAAILGALDGLVERTGDGDVVVVSYSGHGSQAPDLDGDELDAWDETIIPHDGGHGSAAVPDIRDDEIHARLLRLGEKTPNVTVIFDSCHSGSVVRDAFGDRIRGVPPPPDTPLPPPVRAEERRREAVGDRYVFIAACRDSETAREIAAPKSEPHGVLTFYLLQELMRAAPGASTREVFERTSARIAAEKPWQHPSAEGALDRELFGVCDTCATISARLLECKGDRVILGAGALHEATVGSVWGIRKVGSTEEIGRVEITEVCGDRSVVRIIAGKDAIVVGDAAVEVAHVYRGSRYGLEICAAAGMEGKAAELTERIQSSGALEVVGDPALAEARVYALAARPAAEEGAPVPQLGATLAPVWAVVGREGRLILPTIPLDGEGAAATLRNNLETLAKQRRVRQIENVDPESRLRGKVALSLLRCAAGGEWVHATAGPRGVIEFDEGESLAIEVQNNADQALYMALFDLDLRGGVNPTRPLVGPNEAFAPGRTVQLGVREGGIRVKAPQGCPFDPGSGEEAGVEILKLFVTTLPTDFSLLAQKGVAAREWETQSIAGALLRAALLEERDPTVSPMGGSGEDWTTVEAPFLVRLTRRGVQKG